MTDKPRPGDGRAGRGRAPVTKEVHEHGKDWLVTYDEQGVVSLVPAPST